VNAQRKSWSQQVVTLRTGREVPELLRELFIDQRRSQSEIAQALGVSRAQIAYWLRQEGISAADRPPIDIEVSA
jgi:predicted XRE-type DNA-binding protein